MIAARTFAFDGKHRHEPTAADSLNHKALEFMRITSPSSHRAASDRWRARQDLSVDESGKSGKLEERGKLGKLRRRQYRLPCVLVLVLMSGCVRSNDEPSATATRPVAHAVRQQRRAFDGAPPVIAHPPLGANCKTCHGTSGQQVPGLGFAPANPHLLTDNEQRTTHCRQCHLFSRAETTFVGSTFQGLREPSVQGTRLYPGAPPVIPHTLTMRANCLSCHAGPAARPEIVCSHPERTHCRQCHLVR